MATTDTPKDGIPLAPGSLEAKERNEPLDRSNNPHVEEDPKATQIQAAVNLRTTSESPDAYEQLPPDRKAMMQLGFKSPEKSFEAIESTELGSKRIVAITASPANLAKLEQEMIKRGFALPLNTPIIRDPESSNVTKFFLIPHVRNIFALAELNKEIPAEITVSNQDTKGIIRFRDLIIPFDTTLLSHTERGLINKRSLNLSTPEAKKAVNPNSNVAPQTFPIPNFEDSDQTKGKATELAQKPSSLPKTMRGESSYLIININALLQHNSKATEKILDKIENLSISEDFTIALDQNGNLIIVNFAQRSGSYMAGLAADIEQSTENRTSILLAKGIFKKDGSITGIENYPDAGTIQHWLAIAGQNPGTYLSGTTRDIINKGRDTTTREMTTGLVAGSTELLKLEKVSRRPKLRIGGPDKLIGYNHEIKQMNAAVRPNSRTKLIVVNGGAGSGKSRLADELLKDHPTALVASVDASGENIPGAALTDLAVTITEAMEKRLDDKQRTRFKEELTELQAFTKLSEDQKIRQVHKTTRGIKEACLRGLLALEKTGGSFLFAIDDIHHIDRFSENHIMDLVEKFLANSKSKVMMMRRPEETYHSTAQEDLITNIHSKFKSQEPGNRPVEMINLQNADKSQKLNLKDPQIAHDYIYHSLPEEMRVNNATGNPKDLGSWPEKLAAKCRTPFDLTSIINGLLENTEQYLIIGPESIDLSQAAWDELDKITNTDLQGFHENRVKRLNPPAQAVLRYISILGAKLSKANLEVLAREIGNFNHEQAEQAFQDLSRGGYIIADEKEGLGIQHDNYKNIALSSLSPIEKRVLIIALYKKFETTSEIHNDKKFALLCELSDSIKLTDIEFWKRYAAHATQAMEDAERERSSGRGYGIAMTILANLKTEEEKKEPLAEALINLKAGGEKARTVPATIKKLLITALFAVVKNGLTLGRFKKTTEAITILEEIGNEEYLTQSYAIGFRAAQIQGNKETMGNYYRKYVKRPDAKKHETLSMELRLAFKKGDFEECKRITSDPSNQAIINALKNNDEAAHTEFVRLRQRISMDGMRKRLEDKPGTDDKTVDADVVLEPGWMSGTEATNIARINQELGIINLRRMSHPDEFHPLQELHLLDQLAEIQAFLGNYEAASQAMNEVWRLAQQMKIPTEAVRVARTKGDIEMMMGISQIKPTPNQGLTAKAIPNGTIIRQYILKAIQTYTENGLEVLDKVEQTNEYQLLIRGQRLRGISTLVLSYQNEMDSVDETKTALIPHLKTAIEDFNFMNQSPQWKSIFTDNNLGGMYSYYLTSSMGHVLQCIDDLGISEQELGIAIPDILDTTNYPGFTPENISGALDVSNTMKDHVGEVDARKIPGLAKVIDLGEKRAQKTGKEPSQTSFQGLKAKHSSIVAQRQVA